MDLLAALAADPTLLPLWAVMLFAAGMYPIGMMFGCSPCCNSPCSQCVSGSLPQTITVEVSGFSDEQASGPDLISLSFESNFGSGAAARVASPGGDPENDKGPISSIEIISTGSEYAKLGRVAPNLMITGSGTGATFTPMFFLQQDSDGFDLWKVDSIDASGGAGYVDGEMLSITSSPGDTQWAAAEAALFLGKAAPELSIPGNATGTVAPWHRVDGTYSIGNVTVTSGGSGYTDWGPMTFEKAPDDVVVEPASAYARVAYVEPRNASVTVSSSGGGGAVLQPVWEFANENSWENPNINIYRLSAMTIVSGGTGYAINENITISFPSSHDGLKLNSGFIRIGAVGSNGEIQQVIIGPESLRWRGARTDALHSVRLLSGGSYYKDDPDAMEVFVYNSGSYYREDASVPPYVANVTVGITQSPPSSGTGAALTAVIDQDTGSETFGQITSVSIDNGGDGYLAWKYVPVACCADYWNGKTFVLKRIDGSCYYQHVVCGTSCGEAITVEYRGPSLPPLVGIGGLVLWYEPGGPVLGPGPCDEVLEGTSTIADCGEFSFIATNEAGVTATVTAGGEYDAEDQSDNDTGRCFTCCYGEEDPPEEIEVEVSDGYYIGPPPPINIPDQRPIGFFAPQYAGSFGMGTTSFAGYADPNLPLPIVVLRRGKPSGVLAYYTDRCNPTWAGKLSVPGFGPDAYDIYAGIHVCGDTAIEGCHQCGTCETRAAARVPYGQGSEPYISSAGCLNCSDTPMCGPKPGEYIANKNVFGAAPSGIPGGVKVRVL